MFIGNIIADISIVNGDYNLFIAGGVPPCVRSNQETTETTGRHRSVSSDIGTFQSRRRVMVSCGRSRSDVWSSDDSGKVT
jgi:hypothetical protein